MDRFTHELSSGERTLVGLARALVNRPEMLFLDEPTASLDPEVAHRVRTRLLELHAEEGFALLMTSHNMADVERLCRRVVFPAGGRVVADDHPTGIAARCRTEDLEEAFRAIAAGDVP
ncbi:MAG: AAA family ATPase [Actinomycetota bacterium]